MAAALLSARLKDRAFLPTGDAATDRRITCAVQFTYLAAVTLPSYIHPLWACRCTIVTPTTAGVTLSRDTGKGDTGECDDKKAFCFHCKHIRELVLTILMLVLHGRTSQVFFCKMQ